ncbi:hypothetical protein LMG27177_02094 [Paraburkholderia fynbosensis]|uniref:Uncharacterized protein n=1 Tax=Paraburkholderia fynbosensis TaxID=1200993 RepID=A0A6J5FT63_9BURK|nr:hypothetical protein LMG27177_02094 [Paraburkholderia fynbosensis]
MPPDDTLRQRVRQFGSGGMGIARSYSATPTKPEGLP